ncbi:MAG TPA: DNA primase [Candidatus Paceibacterota bacterium]
MPTPVEQIKSRLSIVDVVGSYLKLSKAGGSYKALCPFHNEKTPSFNVSPSRDAYYCFGCNRGGDIFTFVQEIEGLDFPGALKTLADRAGVELRHENMEAKSERERLLGVMEESTNFYEDHLEKNPAVKEYLTGRGLEEKTIRSFRIGYAPLEWRLAYDHLKAKGYKDQEIERAGLTKTPDGEKRPYDRFRGRVMFPIFDTGGRVVAFSGRVFGHQTNQDGTDVAKYINSPETPLYDKSSVLFGYDRAKVAIRKQNFAVLVEGQMDLIMAHQAGTENTVAVSGTALTERHLALLKRLTDNLVFAFDADEAGLAATARAFQIALSLGMAVRVAAIPEGKDPADYILKNKEGWAEVIASSKHIVDFYISALADEGHDPRKFRSEVEQKVLPLILAMQSKIEQAHFIVEVARKLGIPEASVWDEVRRLVATGHTIAPPAAETPDRTENPVKSRRQLAEEEIIGILLWQEGFTRGGATAEGNKEPAFDVVIVRSSYEERVRSHGLTPHLPSEDEARNLIIRAEHTYEHGPELKDSIDEMLDTLEGEVLKEKQAELMKKIIEAKMHENEEGEREYLRLFQEITPRVILLEDRRIKRGAVGN